VEKSLFLVLKDKWKLSLQIEGKMMIKKLFEKYIQYILILPGILFLLFMSIYPLFFSLIMSFKDYSLINPQMPFVGIENYLKTLLNPWFWQVLRNTLIFVFLSVSISFFFGFFIALLVKNVKGKSVFQVLFILPTLMSSAVVGRVWRSLYHPIYGWVNYFLGFIGISPQDWLGNSQLALSSAIVVDVWQWTPFVFLILLSGLMSVPESPLEAAKVDGASNWQIFRHITFPLMSPVILLVLLFRIVDTFRAFGTIYTLTKGGPGLSTETLSLWVYRWGFMRLSLGRASSISYLLLIIVLIITTSLIRKLYKSL